MLAPPKQHVKSQSWSVPVFDLTHPAQVHIRHFIFKEFHLTLRFMTWDIWTWGKLVMWNPAGVNPWPDVCAPVKWTEIPTKTLVEHLDCITTHEAGTGNTFYRWGHWVTERLSDLPVWSIWRNWCVSPNFCVDTLWPHQTGFCQPLRSPLLTFSLTALFFLKSPRSRLVWVM